MTRRALLPALALVVTVLVAAPVQAKAPTSVGIGLREFTITTYKRTVTPGRVVFNLKNFGEDAHDLKVTGPRGYASQVSPEVAPFGGEDRLRVTLRRRGTYRLICTIADHAALGMTATLRVRKPSS